MHSLSSLDCYSSVANHSKSSSKELDVEYPDLSTKLIWPSYKRIIPKCSAKPNKVCFRKKKKSMSVAPRQIKCLVRI
jgi:hypothetical protein